ncbi:hypothetical protein [Enterovibrio sp. 27052020O]|uniref:hypothetical protein n=1 Tax=Enterovibrio sp. 27052020O TaxID=3241166 RepID=UPI00388F1531
MTSNKQGISKVEWGECRSKLLPIMAKTATRNSHDFTQQVDDALTNGSAFLFIADDGFMVLKPTTRNGVIWVTVMFAFNWGGDAISRYQSHIETMTRQIGGRGVELFTAVAALSPILLDQGYSKAGEQDGIQHWQKVL